MVDAEETSSDDEGGHDERNLHDQWLEIKENLHESENEWSMRLAEGDLLEKKLPENAYDADVWLEVERQWKDAVRRLEPMHGQFFERDHNIVDLVELEERRQEYLHLKKMKEIASLGIRGMKAKADKKNPNLPKVKVTAMDIPEWDPSKSLRKTAAEFVEEGRMAAQRSIGADLRKTQDRRTCITMLERALPAATRTKLQASWRAWEQEGGAKRKRGEEVPTLEMITVWLDHLCTKKLTKAELINEHQNLYQFTPTIKSYEAYVGLFKASLMRMTINNVKLDAVRTKAGFFCKMHSDFQTEVTLREYQEDKYTTDSTVTTDDFIDQISDKVARAFPDSPKRDEANKRRKTGKGGGKGEARARTYVAYNQSHLANSKKKGGSKGGGGRVKGGGKGQKGGKGNALQSEKKPETKDLCSFCGKYHGKNQERFLGCWQDPSTKKVQIPDYVTVYTGSELAKHKAANIKAFHEGWAKKKKA